MFLISNPLPSKVGGNAEMTKPEQKSGIFRVLDSLCSAYSVPYELVYEIGMNESRWKNSEDLEYIQMCGIEGEDSRGDLQVNMKYAEYFKNRYNVSNLDRIGLLEISVKHLSWLGKRHKSWRKARFVYARGSWRGYKTWTNMEQHFMNKINWYKYD